MEEPGLLSLVGLPSSRLELSIAQTVAKCNSQGFPGQVLALKTMPATLIRIILLQIVTPSSSEF